MGAKNKFFNIADQIISKIHNGVYPVGSTLPNLDEISQIYGVCRVTAQHALNHLSEGGYISACRGRRTIVISRDGFSRENYTVKSKRITILGNVAVSNYSSVSTPLLIVHHLNQQFLSLGNQVNCLEYTENIDLMEDQTDAYVVVDMLGYRRHYVDLVAKTGKPYVIVSYLQDSFCKPNYVHLNYRSAFLKMTNQFIRARMKNFVFVTMDTKSISPEPSPMQSTIINTMVFGGYIEPITETLIQHGYDRDRIQIKDTNYKTETAAQLTTRLLEEGIGRRTGFVVLSENSATGLYKTLTKHGWTYGKDFSIVVFDPIKTLRKAIPIHRLDLNMNELMEQVAVSLDFQFKQETIAPGMVVDAHFNLAPKN